jgi:serine/threonine protein kinase
VKLLSTLEYDRTTLLGQGGFGSVYEINEPQLGGVLAVKEIEKSSFTDPNTYFAEAQRVHAVDHPNVVPVRYGCERSDVVCLVMPLLRGGPLSKRIEHGPLREREVIRVGLGVLAGLRHIHTCNVIHFDLKPSNVLFDDADHPRIADFGQSARIDPSLGTAKPPPLYSVTTPPEVLQYTVGTSQSDIYHVGFLLYRAANGEPHYKRQIPVDDNELMRRIRKGKFPDRKCFLAHVSAGMRRVIRKALQIDPAKRFQTASEMADALARVKPRHDWHVNVSVTGTSWRAPRPGAAALLVELARDGGATYRVDVLTDGPAGRRAKEPGTFRKQGLSGPEAMKHLEDVVFANL